MNHSTCDIPECERSTHCRGYCQKHYVRLLKHGDPTIDIHRVKISNDGRQVCKACGVAKESAAFHKDGGSPSGYRSQCKQCRASQMAIYLESNKDRIHAYQRSRRIEQPEVVRALDLARYERDKDKRIALASDNVRLRRARIAGILSDPNLTTIRLREIHGDLCCYCDIEMDFIRGKRGEGIAPNRATLEHVLPVSRGGTHTFDNAALACHRCNVSKNSKTVEEFEAWKAGGQIGREEAVTSSEAGHP